MGIKKTLGGDRLGSGNRMKQEMHDFYRSNKNLSTMACSTMQAGVLYPMYTQVALKGDTFDIDINSFVRTIPTQGPLYGSFKMQVDMFQVPFRLYQGILHNNTIDIANKMDQVYLPQLLLKAKVYPSEYENGFKTQINESALLRYLNMSGVGRGTKSKTSMTQVAREILAIPTLSYYDIFKNYYSNKQEENAYVITPNIVDMVISDVQYQIYNGAVKDLQQIESDNRYEGEIKNSIKIITINGANLNTEDIEVSYATGMYSYTYTLKEWEKRGIIRYNINEYKTNIDIEFTANNGYYIDQLTISGKTKINSNIALTPFPLSNIDKMRKYLLTQWDLGTKVVLSQENQNYLPYSAVTGTAVTGEPNNIYPLNGLVVKCYQSDLFNNWLDTEWVNDITSRSQIDVTSGSFTLDTLNFKKKLYDHLNRLAISGGTYDDWQEATYGQRTWGKSEKPIYCGGMSAEVAFDEVISTAATDGEPLGTIAGRGTLNTRKGGHVTIKVGEASIIMCIVSLTPRLVYTQGNAWYNTELKTMDDLHKPIFDRIGFQDLLIERMAWWDTEITPGSVENPAGLILRRSAGKQPAWIEYATDVDRAYGDFAKKEGLNFMVLSRNYEQDEMGDVADVTTYIDPRKFNYAFAYTDLDAQNFWTFIKFKIHARRMMSNTQIPNV